jgi:tetratricopeptide (TPR) repeat protein
MKKISGICVSMMLVCFLCTSNLWAGDSEIRRVPGESTTPAMPLTMPEPEMSTETVAEPETAMPEEAVTAPEPSSVDAAIEEVAEEAEQAAEAATEKVEEAAEAVEEAAEEMVAEEAPAPKDDLTIAGELLDGEGIENYKKALALSEAAVKQNPDSYKANWMAARACRIYGMEAQELGLADWKDICREYGKKGMAYAEKAIELRPEKVEGHFWYGMNVGIYADSVSILTALKEGLKDKTQNSFETAYKIDKYYEDAGAIAALGRFWTVLPWPLNDKDKAMEYFREYEKTEFFGKEDNVQVHVYFAELLQSSRKTKDEAIKLLKEVPRISQNKYWNGRAQEMLKDI